MQIIYTCPQCGHDLHDVMLTCDPPIHRKECIYCGWSHEEEQEQLIRIPYDPSRLTAKESAYIFQNDACRNCSNNPANGGSGICHCILGTLTVY